LPRAEGETTNRSGRTRPGEGSARNLALTVALAATALCTLLAALHLRGTVKLPLVDGIELVTLDGRFLLRGPRAPQTDVVLLGLDDDLRREYPDVLQTRTGWARLLVALAQAEPRLVAIDAFFASPEVVLPDDVVARVRDARRRLDAAPLAARDSGPPADAIAAARGALDAVDAETHGDERLAAALRRLPPTALAALFFLDAGERRPAAAGAAEPPGIAGARYDEAVLLDRPAGQRPPRAEASVWASLPLLATATTGAGSVNVTRDEDGKVRRMPLAIERAGRLYAPLGLWLAARVLGTPEAPASLGLVSGEEVLHLGERELPVDSRAGAILDWLGPGGGFTTRSAADLLAGRLGADALRDRVVLVGYSDAARDRVSTPFDSAVSGLEVHATLLDNALHGGLLRMAPPWATVLAVLVVGLLCTLLQLRRLRAQRAWLAAAGAVLVLGLHGLVAQVLFAHGVVVGVALPAAAAVFIALVATGTALVTEGRERAVLRQAFSQYVSGTLVEQIVANPEQARLGGQRRELSVLFSDIRGFSKLSEGMEPEQLSALLNDYLTPMTGIVLDEHGMLDKYIGDAVMAVYGAPLPREDHADCACRSALRMQAELAMLNARWTAAGRPALRIGVGVNSGVVSVGNMGSELRFDYTVLGDAVNLASRLEALTKEFGAQILVGEATRRAASDTFVFRKLGAVRVKGRAGTEQVYELCGTVDECFVDAETLTVWAQAVAALRRQAFAEAVALVEPMVARRPDDEAAHKLLERARALAADPPEGEWDGVYEQRSK
jgi:adenylate cyclase